MNLYRYRDSRNRDRGCGLHKQLVVALLVVLLTLAYSRVDEWRLFVTWQQGKSPAQRAAEIADVRKAASPYLHFVSIGQDTGVDDEDFWIDRYLSWHARSRNQSNQRYLIYYSPHSHTRGLGNRYRGLLRLYLISVLTRRIFLVHWPEPFPFSLVRASAPGTDLLYDAGVDAPSATDWRAVTTFSVNDSRNSTLLADSLLGPGTHVFVDSSDNPALDNSSIAEFSSDSDVTNDLRKPRPALFRAILRRVLPPSKKLLHAASKPRRNTYISIHARLGQGVGEEDSASTRFNTSAVAIATCLASRAHRISVASGLRHVYLATDTPSFHVLFREAAHPSLRHMSGMKNRAPQHFTDISSRDMFMLTYRELVLLGSGRHLISTRSGFSSLAFAFGSAWTHTRLEPSKNC